MTLKLQRIVLFVSDLEKEAAFYREKLGLPVSEEREGWIEFEAGACRIALHRGKRKPRLDFDCEASLESTRRELQDRGLRLSDIKPHPVHELSVSNGKDPEGNPFRISG